MHSRWKQVYLLYTKAGKLLNKFVQKRKEKKKTRKEKVHIEHNSMADFIENFHCEPNTFF